MSVDFSSWPREQEQSFVVYEQWGNEASRKAYTVGGIVGAVWLFLMVGIYFGVAPDHKDMTKGMNMENLTKKSKKEAAAEKPAAPAEKPAEAPAEKPAEAAAEKPAEAPAAAPAEESK